MTADRALWASASADVNHRLDPVDGQRARAIAYHDVVALTECFLACPAGSIMEWKSAMVLACYLTAIRGQCALGIALTFHARPLSTTIQAMLVVRMPYSHEDCQATPAV
jgi:hypothetical protein